MEYFNTETTAMAIILMFLIKEMFAYLKEKQKGNNIQDIDATQEIKLATIEERLDSMEKLTSNHVAHIQSDIAEIRKQIDRICGKIDK
jgi:low affinity Fe/Cu permease